MQAEKEAAAAAAAAAAATVLTVVVVVVAAAVVMLVLTFAVNVLGLTTRVWVVGVVVLGEHNDSCGRRQRKWLRQLRLPPAPFKGPPALAAVPTLVVVVVVAAAVVMLVL